MKSAIICLLLALLACTVHGYVSKMEYFAVGVLRANYVVLDSTSNNRGRYLFRYEAKSRTLNFHVISTLSSIGAVTLNGPFSCTKRDSGNSYQPQTAPCVSNSAPVVVKLGTGIVPAEGADATGFQIFKGAVTLSSVQESMLFNSELYLVVNTVVTTSGKSVDTPAIRSAAISVYGHSSTSFASYLIFENNKGAFPGEKSKTSNAGFGYITHNPGTKQLAIYIYTTIQQTGKYFLKCNSGSKTFTQSDNPLENDAITFTDAEAPLLLELLLDKSCYILITSAEAIDGDLFSYFYNMGGMEATALGTTDNPSPYVSYTEATFDYSYKTLDLVSKHNVTDEITAAHIHDEDDTVICDLVSGTTPFPARSYCALNETQMASLQKGSLYLQVHTTNPDGAIRGQLVFNTKGSSLARSSSGGSSSNAVALGVGLGVGIPILLVAAVGVFFLAKKSGGGGGKI